MTIARLPARRRSGRGLRATVAGAAIVSALVVSTQIQRADAAVQWSDGTSAQSTVTACDSIIFPPARSEFGAAAWVGYLNNPSSNEPYPGEVYYVRTVVYGQGNPCSDQRARPEISLPPNTSLAISAANPVYCFAIKTNGTFPDQGECPQTLSAGIYGGTYAIPSPDAANAHLWPVPQGQGWEFRVPVVSSIAFSSGTLRGYTKMIDGNSSPVLTPTASVGVFARTPAFGAVTTTFSTPNFDSHGMLTTAILNPYGVQGEGWYDLLSGSGGSVAYSDGPIPLPAGSTGTYGLTEDWIVPSPPAPAIVAGGTYYFRVRYVTAGATYTTPQQSFTAQPATGGTLPASTSTTTTIPSVGGGGTPGGGTTPPTTPPASTTTTSTTPVGGATPGGGNQAAREYAAINPGRILETRTDPGASTIDGQGLGHGIVAGGSEIELQVGGRAGVPVDASAASLNVTVTGAQGAGYATVYPCGAARPTTSNLNFGVGQTIPNAVIAKLGTGGRVCIYTNVGTHLLADVNGYFPAGSSYAPIVPARVLETRTGPDSTTIDGQALGHGIVAGGDEIELQVAGRAGVPANAAAAVLNVTVTGAQGNGYVTVYPCGATRPTTSNLNFTAGQTIPNAVIAKIGTGGRVCLYANVGTHLLADIDGYFPAGSSYAPIVPSRILETRQDPGGSTIDGLALGHGIVNGGDTIELQVAGRGGVPANATAAVLNVTVTGAVGDGYVTVFPCGAARPTTSNLNYSSGQTIPNAVIAKIGTDGKVCLYANSGTHLLADVDGYFPG